MKQRYWVNSLKQLVSEGISILCSWSFFNIQISFNKIVIYAASLMLTDNNDQMALYSFVLKKTKILSRQIYSTYINFYIYFETNWHWLEILFFPKAGNTFDFLLVTNLCYILEIFWFFSPENEKRLCKCL